MAKQLTERRMVRRATPMLFDALRLAQQACNFTHELAVGYSIADIVILRTSRAAIRPGAPLSVNECAILSCLRQLGEAHLETISQSVYLQTDAVRSLLLGRLATWRLAYCERGDVFRPSVGWVNKSELIAVEAKLTRWRDALVQAATYLRYANRSYVLLPEEMARTASEYKGDFLNERVGLLSYNGTGVIRIIPAPKLTDHTWHREFAISRIM